MERPWRGAAKHVFCGALIECLPPPTICHLPDGDASNLNVYEEHGSENSITGRKSSRAQSPGHFSKSMLGAHFLYVYRLGTRHALSDVTNLPSAVPAMNRHSDVQREGVL